MSTCIKNTFFLISNKKLLFHKKNNLYFYLLQYEYELGGLHFVWMF